MCCSVALIVSVNVAILSTIGITFHLQCQLQLEYINQYNSMIAVSNKLAILTVNLFHSICSNIAFCNLARDVT